MTDKQLYLPFLGVALRENLDGENPMGFAPESLLPSAQMLLFLFIYGKCKPLYLTEAVKKFNFSPVLIDTDKQCALEFWKYDGTLLSKENQANILSLDVCFAENANERIQTEIDNLLEKVWE